MNEQDLEIIRKTGANVPQSKRAVISQLIDKEKGKNFAKK
jgi:hypothetical protein